MTRRLVRRIALPLLVAVPLVAAGLSAEGASRYPGAFNVIDGSASNERVRATGLTGDKVRVTWGYTNNTTAYHVKYSPSSSAENRTASDRWGAFYSPALARTSRSYDLPLRADQMTTTPYGNPVFVWARAWNSTHKTKRDIGWKAVWPTPATPDPSGLQVRVGAWNVMCSGCDSGRATWPQRRTNIVKTIANQKLDIVALSEATGPDGDGGRQTVYQDLNDRLVGMDMVDNANYAPNPSPHQGNRIAYNPTKFAVEAKGVLDNVTDFSRSSGRIHTPWALFRDRSTGARFYVVSTHFENPRGASAAERTKKLGWNAGHVIDGMKRVNTADLPLIVAGDLNAHRYPEGVTSGPQPTFVRAGFYDSFATQRRFGVEYPTYNGYQPPSKQKKDGSSVGLRIDYILTRGFTGSEISQNVWNPGLSGAIPSDHNLVLAQLRIPRR